MAAPLILLRILGLTAAGFALGAGWKLGSHLVEVAMGEKSLTWPSKGEEDTASGSSDPLLKRRFSKISD